jgi:hypothetical protein
MVNGVPVIMPPPEGYVVDFDNPQRNSVTEAYWLCGVGNFFCLLFMLQRVYVRAVVQRRVHWEDGELPFSLSVCTSRANDSIHSMPWHRLRKVEPLYLIRVRTLILDSLRTGILSGRAGPHHP